MGRVVVSFKIFPSDIDIKLADLKENIKKKIPSEAFVYKYEEEPIAFGLVGLIAHIVIPEEVEGGMEKIEEVLKGVDGVGETQVLMVGRI